MDVIFSNVHPEVRAIRYKIFVRGSHIGSDGKLLAHKRDENVQYITTHIFHKYVESFCRAQLTPDQRAQAELKYQIEPGLRRRKPLGYPVNTILSSGETVWAPPPEDEEPEEGPSP